ncbi:hypothetical protein [Haladaptatus sp. CMAA 1911]|uniref:hypothetical protein n=1 Tax=unclassified Haladaptatus TaxID=2622732 RepID=UPI00375432FC
MKAVSIPPRVDRWAYATWYVEDFLMSSGLRLPDCSHLSTIGNYDAYWPKLCTRVYEPGQAYANVFAERVTGLRFTSTWRRFFLLTAGLKFLAGYLLGGLYTNKRKYQLLAASLVFLVPDYSAMYITEARGLSFPILLLGVYSTVEWKRGQQRMFVSAVVCLTFISYLYFPRTILLFAILIMFSVVCAVQRNDRLRFVTATAAAFAIVYLLQLQSVIRNIFKYDVLTINGESANSTFIVALHDLIGISGENSVPFIVSAPPYGAITLLPIAIASGLSCMRAFSIRKWSFFLDERLIWVYTIIVTYIPVSFSASFFWSRIFFEMAVPGLLITVDQLEQAIDEHGHKRMLVSWVMVLAIIMAAGNIATIPDPIVTPYQQDNYEELATELQDHGIDQSTPIYTDMKTGAYLVGEYQYKWVYRINEDRNRDAMIDVWYGTNATRACQYIKSKGDVRYFILNEEVKTKGLAIENYDRKPINETAYRKFEKSKAFDKYFQTDKFVVYRVRCDERIQRSINSRRYPAASRYSLSRSTLAHRAF